MQCHQSQFIIGKTTKLFDLTAGGCPLTLAQYQKLTSLNRPLNPKFQVAAKYFECDSLLIINQHSLICLYLFPRDIGLEAIRQAGFYRVIDVRQMEGYPTRTDENGLMIQNPANEFHNLRYRAFTM